VQGKKRLESICRLWLRFRSLVSTDRAFQALQGFSKSYRRWPSFDSILRWHPGFAPVRIEGSLSRAYGVRQLKARKSGAGTSTVQFQL